jgi:hypothetical protein
MQLTAAEVLARWTLRRDTRRSGVRRQGHIDDPEKDETFEGRRRRRLARF